MANKKFSDFDLKTDPANVDFLVGYDGTDNVRIDPDNLGGGGASDLNGLSDVSVDLTNDSAYFINIPTGLSGATGNLVIGEGAGNSIVGSDKNTILGFDAFKTSSDSGRGENVVIGYEAVSTATNQVQYAVAIGAQSAQNNANAYGSVSIGWQATKDASTFSGVFVGSQSGRGASASYATAIGGESGMFMQGSEGIAIGRLAGRNLTGNYSIAIGGSAARSSTAVGHLSIGYQAGYSQTSGSENTNIGFKAGYSNTSSGSNTKVGYECAYHNTGQQTAALGYRALYGSSGASSGSYNTAMGRESGVAVTSGSQNTLIGAAAGKVITTGGNNTVIGSFAGFNTVATGSNNILIGQNSASSSSSVSNEVNLFNGSVVARFQGSASAWSFVSDARDKKDIEDLNLGLDFISKLKPRKFKWNLRDSEVDKNKEASGFVAQEVKEVLDEMSLNYTGIVDTNNPNQYTISQANIIPMLVKAIQELKLELDNSKNCK